MRCIFCKQDSSTSRSVEHIVPESLGNVEHTLPVGVVCDGCNQYFARKVERPVLESPMLRLLRAEMDIPNKRGRLPNWQSEDGTNRPDYRQ
ncbi:HNH endonuclease, partial [Leptospira sp. SA-E8]|uniref:HNH endonuclease n=1 Tax=Leptospira sp. SA-E8 TaxID=3422259 RepID=UPI003EC1532A